MHHDLRRGARHALISAMAFSVMGACIKQAAQTTPNELVVFIRCAVSLAILLPWLTRRGGAGIRTQRPGGHLLRAGFGIASMYAFFYAIAHLPLAEAMLLTYSMPLWIPFIAWFWLQERPSPVVLPAAILGLVGIVLITRPGLHPVDTLAAIVGAVSGLLAACAMVSIRRLTDSEPATRVVFYFALLGTAIASVPLLWAWQMPSLPALGLLVAAGALATFGQIHLTRAYSCAPAALVGPFTYVSVLLAAGIGWLIWDERLDRWSLLGAGLVITTCLMVTLAGRKPAAR